MKIGILTLPLHTNYGGILQAYALQTVLERMGHEVVVFDKILPEPSLPLWKCPFVYSKRLVNKLLGRKDNIVFLEKYVSKIKPIIQQNTNKFIKNYIHEPTLKSKACLKCLYFTKIISDLCRNLECFSYLYTINQTE